jgi:hypothetical protein
MLPQVLFLHSRVPEGRHAGVRSASVRRHGRLVCAQGLLRCALRLYRASSLSPTTTTTNSSVPSAAAVRGLVRQRRPLRVPAPAASPTAGPLMGPPCSPAEHLCHFADTCHGGDLHHHPLVPVEFGERPLAVPHALSGPTGTACARTPSVVPVPFLLASAAAAMAAGLISELRLSSIWGCLLSGVQWGNVHLALFTLVVFLAFSSHLVCMTTCPGVMPRGVVSDEELQAQGTVPRASSASLCSSNSWALRDASAAVLRCQVAHGAWSRSAPSATTTS